MRNAPAIAAFLAGATTHIATGAVRLSLQAQGLLFFMLECCVLQLVPHLENNMLSGGYHCQSNSLAIYYSARGTEGVLGS